MYPKPAHRRIQVFSLDPAADVQTETALISRSVLNIPWEDLTPSQVTGEGVGPGPVGEYLEIIDIDPSSDRLYEPVDLDDPTLLATDGLAPSSGNPQFHQQMVYAVAMKTITNFEQALGRKVLWSERSRDENGGYLPDRQRFVRRLRIYPHALREQNAYYSPTKKALLFGYFNAPTTDPREELPGGMVFTCLSHDIVAHEVTHAILDGIHRRLLDASNPDMLAFHEAFSDIIAIFQHFTLPGLLVDQIQRTRGDLRTDSFLVKLAVQFARSTGRGEALRNALGRMDEHGNLLPPDPAVFGRTFEPHDRGAILVAAVFDAFLKIYESRVADLKRIATSGTGILPEGSIYPDLAHRFAEEATTAADRVLTMCIRAVDYLPPVDITFGDYLRALITADADLTPDDPQRHRLAFIQAFRDRGIYPLDVRTLAEDSLLWNRVDPTTREWEMIHEYMPPANLLRTMAYGYSSLDDDAWLSEFYAGKGAYWQSKDSDLLTATGELLSKVWSNLGTRKRFFDSSGAVPDDRRNRFLLEKAFARILQDWITQKAQEVYHSLPEDKDERTKVCDMVGKLLGLDLEALMSPDEGKTRRPQRKNGKMSRPKRPLEVHAVRPTMRLRPDGHSKVELLIILTQKHILSLTDDEGKELTSTSGEPLTFKYRGGCTLIVDPDLGSVEYSIFKNLCSSARLARQEAFLKNQLAAHGEAAIRAFQLTESTREAARKDDRSPYEPLAVAHRQPGLEGGY